MREIDLPHALAEPHPTLLGRGLVERCCPTEGDENGEKEKELHPDTGCLAFECYMGVFIRTARSMYFKGCPK